MVLGSVGDTAVVAEGCPEVEVAHAAVVEVVAVR